MVLFGSEDRLGQVLYTLSVRYGLATTRIIGERETRDSLLDRVKIVGERADIVKLARNLQYRHSKGEIDYLPAGLVVVGGCRCLAGRLLTQKTEHISAVGLEASTDVLQLAATVCGFADMSVAYAEARSVSSNKEGVADYQVQNKGKPSIGNITTHPRQPQLTRSS